MERRKVELTKYYEEKERFLKGIEEKIEQKTEWIENAEKSEEEAKKLVGDCSLYMTRFGKKCIVRSTDIFNSMRQLVYANQGNLERFLAATKGTEVPHLYGMDGMKGNDQEATNAKRYDLTVDVPVPPGMEMDTDEGASSTTSATSAAETARREGIIPPPRSSEEEVRKLGKAPARVLQAMLQRQEVDQTRRQREEEKKKKQREEEERRKSSEHGSG